MIKTRKKEKILVEKSKIEKLMKFFGCGRATVYNALAYSTNSEMAQKIRHRALNHYGGVVNKFTIPVK